MALTKTIDGLAYEATPVSKKVNGKSAAVKYAQQLSSGRLVWILVSRHKVGILFTWAIVVTIVQLFPFAPGLVLGVFK